MRIILVLEQPPVREARVGLAAIARTPLIAFVGAKRLPKTGLSNGTQMLVYFAAYGSTKTPAIRDGAAAAGSVPNRGPEGMMRTCENGVMRRAGTTGAEVG